MAKRFTDTTIWDKDWFLDLSDRERNQFMFIKDRCDYIGVYKVMRRIEQAVFGEAIDSEALIAKCNGNLIRLDGKKLLLPDFCFFQYGELKETCKPHKKYIDEITKAGLQEKIKGYPKGIHTLEEEEEEEEKEKESLVVKEINKTSVVIEPPPELIFLFQRVCGMGNQLTTWLNDCAYPPEWIKEALIAAETRGINNAVPYCKKILEGYQKQGGVDSGKQRQRVAACAKPSESAPEKPRRVYQTGDSLD